jgi:hypothetical protein
MDIVATSVADFNGTLSASSTSTLDLDFAITDGDVTMSTGSTWTLATAGVAGSASNLTITGYGDVAEGTDIVLAGSTFTFDASGLSDSDGLHIDASNLTGVGTLKGSQQADTITGSNNGDAITGGNGVDDYIGGTGADTLVLTETIAAADNVTITTATNGLDTITGFDFGGGASNDNIVLTIPNTGDIAGGGTGSDTNVSTAINAGGATITALAADTAAVAGTDFALIAVGDATSVALTATQSAIETAVAAKMADGTDIAANITAATEGFAFLFPNDADGDGTVDSYFLGAYAADATAATTAAADINIVGIFTDADAANAAAADFT